MLGIVYNHKDSVIYLSIYILRLIAALHRSKHTGDPGTIDPVATGPSQHCGLASRSWTSSFDTLLAHGRKVLVFSQFVTILDIIEIAIILIPSALHLLTAACDGRTGGVSSCTGHCAA